MKECLQKGTELVQAIADSLFILPSTQDVEGPLVHLPAPSTRLPREKHVFINPPFLSRSILIFTFNYLLIKFYNVFSCQGQNLLLNGTSLPKRKVSCAVLLLFIYLFFL